MAEDIEIVDDIPEPAMLPDGSAVFDEVDASGAGAGSPEFTINLAEVADESDLMRLSTELVEAIEVDRESRKKRDKQYEEGLQRTGLGNDAPGGAGFQGASRVVHPGLAEACVDFSASAMKELFPPDGPARIKIMGDSTVDKVKFANRKRDHLNYQLTELMPEYADELHQLLTQLGLGGSQYMKLWWDQGMNRPTAQFIPIDNIYLPYHATSFYTSPRLTHVQEIDHVEFYHRVQSGMYRSIDNLPVTDSMEKSAAEKANEKIEGKEDPGFNLDDVRQIFEIQTFLELDWDPMTGGALAPYILTIDEMSGRVLSLYRNWSEDDPLREKIDWIIEFRFIPWRGAYAIGFPHLIGGLSAAATGAMRALLDAAFTSQVPTLAKLKGMNVGGQSRNMTVGSINEIEGGETSPDPDIRKLAFQVDFPQPSAVLYELLGFVDRSMKGVVRTAIDESPEQYANTPVGTQLARIEQGMKVFSSIHAGLHRSQKRFLRALQRLNRLYNPNPEVRSLYETTDDIIPVSDPNIFSESQRYQQAMLVKSLQEKSPQLYNQYAVERRVLETAKVPDIEEILPPPPVPKPENPVAENVKMMMGNHAVAFPHQDHLAHLAVHTQFLNNPVFGKNQAIETRYMPQAVEHMLQHLAFFYAQALMEKASEEMGQDVTEIMDPEDQSGDIDRILMQASNGLLGPESQGAFERLLGPVKDVILQAVDIIRKNMPPPPVDPGNAAIQSMQIQTNADKEKELLRQQAQKEIKMQEIVINKELENQRLQIDFEKEKMRADIKLEEERQQTERARERNRIDYEINRTDNETALKIARMRIDASLLDKSKNDVSIGGMINGNSIVNPQTMAGGGPVQDEHVEVVPARKKNIRFIRDPNTGEMVGAEVLETLGSSSLRERIKFSTDENGGISEAVSEETIDHG